MALSEIEKHQLPLSTSSAESLGLQEATLEYLKNISHTIGRVPSPSELGDIAQRNATILFSHKAYEKQSEGALQQILQNWGIDPLTPNILQMNGKEIEITITEYRLLKSFAESPGYLLTYTNAQKEFKWADPKVNLSTQVDRLRQKIRKSDKPLFNITPVRTLGYRIDPITDSSTLIL